MTAILMVFGIGVGLGVGLAALRATDPAPAREPVAIHVHLESPYGERRDSDYAPAVQRALPISVVPAPLPAQTPRLLKSSVPPAPILLGSLVDVEA